MSGVKHHQNQRYIRKYFFPDFSFNLNAVVPFVKRKKINNSQKKSGYHISRQSKGMKPWLRVKRDGPNPKYKPKKKKDK
jgi:hypothetical protein